jgi:polynucleotide 5'-hydroxyl-kinase GRC3/NOL9
MKRFIDGGKTVLVDGPASVKLLSGEISVFGAPLKLEENIIVREGKRLPFWVTTRAIIELLIGEGASVKEVEGTVPNIWNETVEKLLSLDKPVSVVVMGGVDSGKTSFCTFIANAAVKEKLRTGVIDADLGQSDVGPPSTVGFNYIVEPVKDLFEINAQDVVFVGSTSPSGTINKIIEGLSYLRTRVLDSGVDFLVINTDGWVEGEEAVAYKIKLVETLVPSAVVGLEREKELMPILDSLRDTQIIVVNSPQLIQPRSREKRKLLRELGYKKYMKKAKIQSFSLSWIKVNNSILGSGSPLYHKRLETLCNLLEIMPVYSEENIGTIFVVLRKCDSVSEEQIEKAEEVFGKRLKVICEGDEKGLLVGLRDEENNFLGIGILHEVDYKRKVLKVRTPVSQKPDMLYFGQIKLDNNFREIGLSSVYSKDL